MWCVDTLFYNNAKLYIWRHICSAGLLLMMSWRGESHSTSFWSVKVSPLAPHLFLSHFCQNAALSVHRSLFVSLSTLRCSWPAYHHELPSGFLRKIVDVFFLQVHQIHSDIYLREDDTGRDKRPQSELPGQMGSFQPAFIHLYSWHSLMAFTWPYSRPPFEKD